MSVHVLDGSSFVLSDDDGDLYDQEEHGLFFRDTRFLSTLRLRLDGRPLELHHWEKLVYYAARFFLTAPRERGAPSLSVVRARSIGDGLRDDIVILNGNPEPVAVTLELELDNDFSDFFEVKGARARRRTPQVEAEHGSLVFGYRGNGFERDTIIGFNAGVEIVPGRPSRAVARVVVPGRDSWRLSMTALPLAERRPPRSRRRPRDESLGDWLEQVPRLETDWRELRDAYRTGVEDLAALQFIPAHGDGAVPAAGLPWFMALFGRDSIISSLQTLPFVPAFARSTLRALARRQATRYDSFRDAEPGKILHEERHGELAALGEMPHCPYYGTADATPLYLVLLERYERWTGDRELVCELEPNARAALRWIDEDGDRDGDGFVEYERRSRRGLDNQCWKDSWNSILFRDGRLAHPPLAVVEIQGYVVAAKRACARLAEEVWHDPALAQRLRREADELVRRIDEAFWLPGRGCYALALDAEKRPVDSLTSNVGHLLWAGAVGPERARALRDLLMSDDLFSGWGIRTMSSADGGFDPLEYHNGTVWPHDNALIAEGLARYGFRAEASRVALALMEASARFGGRMPELFSGSARVAGEPPERYPAASAPQAWAAGAPLALLTTVLALEAEQELVADPRLPAGVGSIEVSGIAYRGRRWRLHASGGLWTLEPADRAASS